MHTYTSRAHASSLARVGGRPRNGWRRPRWSRQSASELSTQAVLFLIHIRLPRCVLGRALFYFVASLSSSCEAWARCLAGNKHDSCSMKSTGLYTHFRIKIYKSFFLVPRPILSFKSSRYSIIWHPVRVIQASNPGSAECAERFYV